MKVKDADQVAQKYKESAPKIVTNWFKVKDKLTERWRTSMNKLLEKYGGVAPEKVKLYDEGIKRVRPETFEEAVRLGAEKFHRNYVEALAARGFGA